MPRALKYYCGAIHVTLPKFPHHHDQRHVYVVAATRKRALELLHPYTLISAYYMKDYFSCVDSAPVPMQDIPLEEGIWIEPLSNMKPVKLTPDMVSHYRSHIQ